MLLIVAQVSWRGRTLGGGEEMWNLCCCASGCLCTVGEAVKSSATHTAGMSCMQSIESVSRGRQKGEVRWEALFKRGWGARFSRWGLLLLKRQGRKRNFPPSKSFSINFFLVGNYQWRSIRVVWSSAGGRKCGGRREMEEGLGGWGEVKGQRKKGGTFSEDGRLGGKREQ